MRRLKRFVLSSLGLLVFLAGILLELALSGGVLWGEIEANSYTAQTGDQRLALNCPLMLSPAESGPISTTITNTLDEDTHPVVTAVISSTSGEKHLDQTLDLAPHETRRLLWTVNPSEVIFGRLILVNIVQSRYSDLPSRQGSCGILVFHLSRLNGLGTFILIFITATLGLLLGAGMWLRAHWPLSDLGRHMARACAAMTGMATAGLLAALPRWWGLTLMLDVITLIIMAVIITEFILFPKG